MTYRRDEFENRHIKNFDMGLMRQQIFHKFCNEDKDFARKQLLLILSEFTNLAKCNKELAIFNQDLKQFVRAWKE